jgi:hypothetical protein
VEGRDGVYRPVARVFDGDSGRFASLDRRHRSSERMIGSADHGLADTARIIEVALLVGEHHQDQRCSLIDGESKP